MIRAISLVVLLSLSCVAAAGSIGWTHEFRQLRVGGPDRNYASTPARAPMTVQGMHVVRVHWRYRLPPGNHVLAWICAGDQCVRLAATRGFSDALAGTPASVPLHFRFRLPSGKSAAVLVDALQLSVDCR